MFLQHPHDEVGVLSYYIIHNPVYCSLHLIVTLLLMLLALFERPAVFPVAEGEIQVCTLELSMKYTIINGMQYSYT